MRLLLVFNTLIVHTGPAPAVPPATYDRLLHFCNMCSQALYQLYYERPLTVHNTFAWLDAGKHLRLEFQVQDHAYTVGELLFDQRQLLEGITQHLQRESM